MVLPITVVITNTLVMTIQWFRPLLCLCPYGGFVYYCNHDHYFGSGHTVVLSITMVMSITLVMTVQWVCPLLCFDRIVVMSITVLMTIQGLSITVVMCIFVRP